MKYLALNREGGRVASRRNETRQTAFNSGTFTQLPKLASVRISCRLAGRVSADGCELRPLDDGLSIAYLNAAIAYPSLTIYEKSILILLANHADFEGVCWPSIPTLCNEGCIKRTSAITAIKGLEKKGLLKVSRHHRQSNIYKLLLKVESVGRTQPVRGTVNKRPYGGLQPSQTTIKNPLRSENKWLGKPAPKSQATPEQLETLKAALRGAV